LYPFSEEGAGGPELVSGPVLKVQGMIKKNSLREGSRIAKRGSVSANM
jgi:hypothetical protein